MDDETVIDTCCLINLCATGYVPEVLESLGGNWYVPTAVLAETIYLRMETEDGTTAPQQLDLTAFVDQAVLFSCTTENAQETELYVDLATSLDDREAMALAIAKARGWVLSTDDRKAQRIAGALGVALVTTPEILNRWVSTSNPTRQQIREAINRIEQRARFVPRMGDPLYAWWSAARGEDLG